ncbi:family 10 glycosylhydrolase [Limnofasciculus baicalensis]|uniref:Family 10 glycosylhydrolase n=1 Tax=Limnofasciculus baicalensis BBK-W-15 TaxID=2699891 RepID=A0AAE3GVQ9_9CYAN|nr:family 10 glycosylhydrolase [Limnofasciculus baicalensis]MCP2730821.1 family 10 glycosylhydrolase [Limnofasciculus baicalensis BBK-W-15]
MFNGFLPMKRCWRHLYRSSVAALWISSSLVSQVWLTQAAHAQTSNYCKFTQEAVSQKENLRLKALKGSVDADKDYKGILKQHATYLQQCRNRTWPQNQAVWLRLYPCDTRAGAIDDILDRIVNRGYNQVYVEVFFDGQVFLPSSDNPTVWPSALRSPGTERIDLLAQAIQKGHERGLQVYAWMFSMNFGYNYAQRPDRQGVLAINGRGETSLTYVDDRSQTFIDPYNNQAKSDYYQLVQAVLRRRPDGILFDYIRYPRGSGSDSVASNVKDLWIYSDASTQALYGRALNNQGLELIKRYISKGSIGNRDLEEVKKLYPTEETPLWQGRIPDASDSGATLNWQLWQLSVAHAAQGVLDFLAVASLPAQRAGIKAGAVFFPDGNQIVGQGGYDSRLQPWDHFSPMLEWHPMSYGVCGRTNCIEDLVRRVTDRASSETMVMPALAGTWGKSVSNRPSLEAQMEAIRTRIPGINGVSHFAFSWQEPQFDRDRKFCRLD